MKKKKVEELCDRELLEKILSLVEKQPVGGKETDAHRLYDNKSLMEMLHIKEKYLKKLRDNGYLGYFSLTLNNTSREGDKYWYSQKDADDFLHRFHYEAFATSPLCPTWEGGAL